MKPFLKTILMFFLRKKVDDNNNNNNNNNRNNNPNNYSINHGFILGVEIAIGVVLGSLFMGAVYITGKVLGSSVISNSNNVSGVSIGDIWNNPNIDTGMKIKLLDSIFSKK